LGDFGSLMAVKSHQQHKNIRNGQCQTILDFATTRKFVLLIRKRSVYTHGRPCV